MLGTRRFYSRLRPYDKWSPRWMIPWDRTVFQYNYRPRYSILQTSPLLPHVLYIRASAEPGHVECLMRHVLASPSANFIKPNQAKLLPGRSEPNETLEHVPIDTMHRH
ncbi:Hypothetical protein NTJ_14457 [Nesidiocoris tenuis]|uniref:Uncharacterized protein n=1 Tax=Nesidiocoris tenuis TaxID=355587 RepID=A0ABN7BEP3_9HEMI|nr:Hypothetical protein NTJ_14457 [Nesidiocoris tenuis]